jgi:hypothetical protein
MGNKPFASLVTLDESEDLPPDIAFDADYFRQTGELRVLLPLRYSPISPKPLTVNIIDAAVRNYIRTHPEEFP